MEKFSSAAAINNKKEIIRDENAVEKIVTHDGLFHTDEVFSTAVFKDLFPEKMEHTDGSSSTYIEYSRTRSKELLDKYLKDNTVLLHDAGNDNNIDLMNQDHHQKEGAGQRENGIKYATAGLAWKNFGKQWIEYIDAHKRKLSLTEQEKDIVWNRIDKRFIELIDANDTGQMQDVQYTIAGQEPVHGMHFTLPEVIRLLGVQTEKTDDFKAESDKNFSKAVELMRDLNLAQVYKEFNLIEGLRNVDTSKFEFDNNGKTLLINDQVPQVVSEYLLHEANDEKYENVEFLASRNPNGDYGVIAVPIGAGLRSYRNNNMIPKEARKGNDTGEINEKLGTHGGIHFVHNAGFFAAIKDEESARKFLKYCTE